MIHIGIDTGTHTGFAVWDSEKRKLLEIETLTITQAMERVLIYRNIALEAGHEIELHIEDARLRKWYGNSGREKLQGAGAVKRDASIWETRCKEQRIDYRTISPTDKPAKMKATPFSRLAGWRETASERGRDAARRKIKRRVSASPSYLFTTDPAPDHEIESNAKITKT